MRLSTSAVIEQAKSQLSGHLVDLELAQGCFSLSDFVRAQPRAGRALIDYARSFEERWGFYQAIDPLPAADPLLNQLIQVILKGNLDSVEELSQVFEHLGLAVVASVAGKTAQVKVITDQLHAIKRLLADNVQLRNSLRDVKGRHRPERLALARAVFSDQVLPETMVLLERAIITSGVRDSKHLQRRSIHSQLDFFQTYLADSEDVLLANVTSALPLSADQQTRLRQILQRKYGRQVHLQTQVSPDLIGGVQIQIGCEIFDGSTATSLQETRKKIAS